MFLYSVDTTIAAVRWQCVGFLLGRFSAYLGLVWGLLRVGLDLIQRVVWGLFKICFGFIKGWFRSLSFVWDRYWGHLGLTGLGSNFGVD